MNTIHYYPFLPNVDINQHPLLDLMYDLDPISPPHTQYKSIMSMCPAMSTYDQHTYIIRSPISFNLKYNNNTWTSPSPLSQEIQEMLVVEEENKPYLQLATYYLFWSDKKTNTKLFLTDPPLYEVNSKPTYYVTSGMIPIGEYTRNTSIGLVLKPDNNTIKVERGDALAAITLVGDEKIQLVKKKPPQHIINENLRNVGKPKYCPYLMTKTLFARWLQ